MLRHYSVVSYVFYSPSQVNFMLFNAVWTIVVLIYLGLAPRFFSRYAHVHAITALDALTMLFWFAGFIALAVFYHDFVEVANYEYSAGCAVTGDYCGVTEAAVVFGAFEWYVLSLSHVPGRESHFFRRQIQRLSVWSALL